MTGHDLYAAPERLPLHLLDQLLDAGAVALEREHATLAHPYGPYDPPTLVAARLVTARIRELRHLLRWYDAAVQDALGVCDSCPF